MKVTEFLASLEEAKPPSRVSVHLKALWYFKRGNWDQAHRIVQDMPDQTAAWIHAFLHRDEGDLWNADYWYRRSGRKRPTVSIEDEWRLIVENLT